MPNNIIDESEQLDFLAKHILKNLNGMVLIDTLRSMILNGEKITKETVVVKLNAKGFNEFDGIIAEPTKILDVFNRESLNAKHIKVFE